MKIKEKSVVSYKYAAEMKNNVIQVGQFLTDVCASKSNTHLKEAEEQYAFYINNLDGFVSLNPEFKDQLDGLKSDFDKMYSYGKEMADMYIKNGHEDGNKMMVEFDEMAKLAASFNNFMNSLESMILNIKKNSAIVSQGSLLLNEGGMQAANGIKMINTHMSRATEDTEKIGTSIRQITDSISQIAQASGDSATDAQYISLEIDNINRLAQESGKLAQDTKLEMERTEELSSTMEAINESNTAITTVVQEVAESISAQTDIVTGLSTTASDLKGSAERLDGLVSRFILREDK